MYRPLALIAAFTLAACGGSSRNADFGDVAAKFGFAANVVPICGSDAILGERIPDVRTASNSACGITDAVRVYAVSGVALNPPARMNCRTANVTNRWIAEHGQRAAQSEGDRIERLHIVADYSCRTRNNQRGAKLSEHAKGNAIDIGSISFASGKRLSVLDDYRGSDGAIMRRIFKSACRAFSTAIGPDGDRFHQDHFHFDAARAYGAGGYCR